MRKLIVSNFLTLDGYYESANRTFDRLFDYFHEDYGANEAFDEYNTELLRGADTLILSGRTSFMTNKDYWVSYRDTPGEPPARLAQAAVHSNLGRLRQHPCDLPADPARDSSAVIGDTG